VGKTTVAVNLAVRSTAWAHQWGCSTPTSTPQRAADAQYFEQPAIDERRILPVEAYGLKMISMGLLNPGDRPMIWRGAHAAQRDPAFLRSVQWASRVPDCGPAAGHGDVQLTLIQTCRHGSGGRHHAVGGGAWPDVRKAIKCSARSVDILGVVENMTISTAALNGRIDVFATAKASTCKAGSACRFWAKFEIDPQSDGAR